MNHKFVHMAFRYRLNQLFQVLLWCD